MTDKSLHDIAHKTVTTRPAVETLVLTLRGREPEELQSLLESLMTEGNYAASIAVILAANFTPTPLDAANLKSLLPVIEHHVEYVPLILRSVCGDIDKTLLDLIEARTLSVECTAVALHYLAYTNTNDLQPRISSAVRTLARQNLLLSTKIILGFAARHLENENVKSIAFEAIALANSISLDSDPFTKQIDEPILDLLPAEEPKKIVSGKTLRRVTDKIHRNDPCPCGSGKKYKKCCINKHTEQDEEEQWETDPAKTMTLPQFRNLAPHLLAAYDPETLPSPYLFAAATNLIGFHLWEKASIALDELERRTDLDSLITLEDLREDLILTALEQGAIEIANEQRLKRGSFLPNFIQTKFDLISPTAATLSKLNAQAKESLCNDHPEDAIDIAYNLLKYFPALGIYFARGCISKSGSVENEILVDEIELARDILLLSPGDPAQSWLDSWMNSWYSDVSLANDPGLDQEVTLLRAKHKAAQDRIDTLEKDLTKKERLLAKPPLVVDGSRHKQKLNENSKPVIESQTPPKQNTILSPEEQQQRTKISDLKSLIRQGNEERRKLRTQLTHLQKNVTASPPLPELKLEDNEEGEDTLFCEGISEVDSVNHPLVPIFSKQAQHTMRELPTPLHIAALKDVSELASQSTDAWKLVKRLKAAPSFYRIRLNIHYRLLFRLNTEHRQLEVVTIIRRSDLERTISKLASKTSNQI
ncbi:MAG: mRNA-degrading endonuclease RelE of RelBE toxin-antitoxin system [Lentisphaeria bacterium]|jgi:mRNA-degrading endonuclease RelE of RelBE toxin-antitoxin system